MIKKRSVFSILIFCIAALIGLYYLCGYMLHAYIDSAAESLLKLEKNGMLSRDYGYVWQEINANKEMIRAENTILSGNITTSINPNNHNRKTKNFPSLAAVEELNKIKSINRIIKINDRNGIVLSQLKTTHTSIELTDLNEILLKSLITTEDKNYYTRQRAYDYNALLRSSVRALFKSIVTFKLQYPRGSSTIQMQVARFLLMKYDRRGYAFSEKSIIRKVNELKLSQALGMLYSKDDILSLYINHCVAAGHGMLGYHDISMGLFGVAPDKLTIPQSLYLARLVKWNRQVPQKIIKQIKSNMPVLRKQFNWDKETEVKLCKELDTLTFIKQNAVLPENSYLIDLANEYWKKICMQNGMNGKELAQIDIADPESMIRRYGNCSITLTIDARLQRYLESIVKTRGFGSDTVIRTDVKLGGKGKTIISKHPYVDTLRKVQVVGNDTVVDLENELSVRLCKGDTLISNIRYKLLSGDSIRRSQFYYKRDTLRVAGQYFSYAMIDSRSNKLLAYCSRDKLGSRLQSLNVNRTPNGSSVAKPLVYALAYDLGVYKPEDMSRDDQEVTDSSLWARKFIYEHNTPVGMSYKNVPESNGYAVHNYSDTFEGYDFIYNHLFHSNNIIAVETMYRLTDVLSKENKRVDNMLARLGIKNSALNKNVTGPEVYSAIAALVSKTKTIGSTNYSSVLGTLELSLYEQMCLFNVLYNNRIIESASEHPSLFVKDISLAGITVSFNDSIRYKTIFSDLHNIAPVHLALHKRLISNPTDQLDLYDHCDSKETSLSNFAKSGTTDDILKPFNADINDTGRTNYGLWNAVLRLKLTKDDLMKCIEADSLLREMNCNLNNDSIVQEEIIDATLACIGECNTRYTGERDGKSLHGYVTRGLLHTFGIPCSSYFYASYEEKLLKTISERKKYATNNKSDLSFFSKTIINLKSTFGGKVSIDQVEFDSNMHLRGKNYRMMLNFAKYTGDNSRRYCSLLDKLKNVESKEQARLIIEEIRTITTDNQVLKRDLERACDSLLKSLERL